MRLARLRGVWIGDAAPDETLRFFDPGKKHAPYQLDLGEHLVRVRAYEDRAKRFGVGCSCWVKAPKAPLRWLLLR